MNGYPYFEIGAVLRHCKWKGWPKTEMARYGCKGRVASSICEGQYVSGLEWNRVTLVVFRQPSWLTVREPFGSGRLLAVFFFCPWVSPSSNFFDTLPVPPPRRSFSPGLRITPFSMRLRMAQSGCRTIMGFAG